MKSVCACGRLVHGNKNDSNISGTICQTCLALIYDEKDCRRKSRIYRQELAGIADGFEALANRIHATLQAREQAHNQEVDKKEVCDEKNDNNHAVPDVVSRADGNGKSIHL